MNIEEFQMTVKPGGKRSRIEPFQAQVFELKAKGYADGQVRDWLKLNGLDVSRQAVQQFVKRGVRPKPALTFPSPTPPKPTAATAPHQVLTPKEDGEGPRSPASDDDDRPLTLQEQRARRENRAKKFVDEGNPLVKQLNLKVGAQNESKRPGEPEKYEWDPDAKPQW